MKPVCICCGSTIEYHAYRGTAARRFFGWQRGDSIGPLCPACYRMLFREEVIDSTGRSSVLFARCPQCGREMSEQGCAMANRGDKRKLKGKKVA